MNRLAFIQNLSIDVTVGAVISSFFVCQYFQVSPDWHIMLGLAIAIWLIYTIDHIGDARQLNEEGTNPRHKFHREYARPISIIAVLIFLIGLVNLYWMPLSTLWCGLGLGAFSGFYFLYLKLSKEHTYKEVFAAVVYSLGIFAAPVSLLESWHWHYLVFFILFFLLVLSNLILFPWYEMDMDHEGKIKSIALNKGDKRTRLIIWFLLSLHMIMVILSVLLMPDFKTEAMTFAAMNGVLCFLVANQSGFRKYQAYRWLGDGIFLLPVIPVLLGQ